MCLPSWLHAGERSAAGDDASLAFPLLLFAVATGSFLYDPHVTPTAIWGLRRFVPVTLPLERFGEGLELYRSHEAVKVVFAP